MGALVSYKPKVFVGSSTNALSVARQVAGLLQSTFEVRPWDRDIFSLSSGILGSLEVAVSQCDFAVLVFNPDDEGTIARAPHRTVRDNVIFETGLFMGKVGPKRTIILCPKGVKNLRIPSDLAGITLQMFGRPKPAGALRGAGLRAMLSEPCRRIADHIQGVWKDQGEVDLKRIMGEGLFSGIDSVFWTHYCRRLITPDKEVARQRVFVVRTAIATSQVRAGQPDAYHLMRRLFEATAELADPYCAIATESDIAEAERSDDAREFLFDTPLSHPNLMRLFWLAAPEDCIRSLAAESRSKLLLQLEKGGVQLRYRKGKAPANFGLYGGKAVGVLDQASMENVWNFNPNAVENYRDDFKEWWRHAIPLPPAWLKS